MHVRVYVLDTCKSLCASDIHASLHFLHAACCLRALSVILCDLYQANTRSTSLQPLAPADPHETPPTVDGIGKRKNRRSSCSRSRSRSSSSSQNLYPLTSLLIYIWQMFCMQQNFCHCCDDCCSLVPSAPGLAPWCFVSCICFHLVSALTLFTVQLGLKLVKISHEYPPQNTIRAKNWNNKNTHEQRESKTKNETWKTEAEVFPKLM